MYAYVPSNEQQEYPNIFKLRPTAAKRICRFCLGSAEPLNELAWFKWPNAEVTRLYEKVIGDQLAVSSHLTESYCNACHQWLIDAHTQIVRLKRVGRFWREYVDYRITRESLNCDDDSESDPYGDGGDPENALQVEYLEDFDLSGSDDAGAKPADGSMVEADESDVYSDDNDNHVDNSVEDDNHAVAQSPSHNDVDECRANGYDHPHYDPQFWNLRSSVVVCDFCASRFPGKSKLIDHMTRKHRLTKHFSCTMCPSTHRTFQELKSHCNRSGHSLLNAFDCDRCFRSFQYRFTLLQHHRASHKQIYEPSTYDKRSTKSSQTYACPDCGRRFNQKREFKYHQEVVHDRRRIRRPLAVRGASQPDEYRDQRRPLVCPKCEMSCMRPITLQKHFESMHPDDDWDAVVACICEPCLRQFASPDEIGQHNAEVHNCWVCDICKKQCACEESLQRHQRIHKNKERPFTCQVCYGTYVTMHQLKMHHRRKHTTERPFACPSCDRRYAERGEMNEHIRSAHGNGERFPCDHCAKTFASTKYLGTHIARAHTGEYNFFRCAECDGKFVNARVLAAHRAVHHPTEVP